MQQQVLVVPASTSTGQRIQIQEPPELLLLSGRGGGAESLGNRMPGTSSCSAIGGSVGGSLGRSYSHHGEVDRKPLLLTTNNNHVTEAPMIGSGMTTTMNTGAGNLGNFFKMSEDALFAMSNGDHAAAFDLIFATAAQVR